MMKSNRKEKVTRKQYDEAKTKIAKLREAERKVKIYEAGVASRPEIDPNDIIAVEETEFGPAITCKPKGTKDAPRIHSA